MAHIQIPIQDLPEGIYYIKLKEENKIIMNEKIVIAEN